jgi:mono/diheme cytochrome c family protein
VKHPKTATAVITVLVMLVGIAAFGLAFILSGVYDVSASHPDVAVMRWALDETMEQSVHRHAKAIRLPDDFQQRDPLRGISHFQEMCVMCHGAPGIERGEVGRGLYPMPPKLETGAATWTPEELYWIIRNGIKMTGMPSFAPTHTEEQLWDITAFVHRLPEMSPDAYEAMIDERAESHAGSGSHEDGRADGDHPASESP